MRRFIATVTFAAIAMAGAATAAPLARQSVGDMLATPVTCGSKAYCEEKCRREAPGNTPHCILRKCTECKRP